MRRSRRRSARGRCQHGAGGDSPRIGSGADPHASICPSTGALVAKWQDRRETDRRLEDAGDNRSGQEVGRGGEQLTASGQAVEREHACSGGDRRGAAMQVLGLDCVARCRCGAFTA